MEEVDTFQLAARRAEASFSVDTWLSLKPSERIAAIYRELRKLDAETVARRAALFSTVSQFRPQRGQEPELQVVGPPLRAVAA